MAFHPLTSGRVESEGIFPIESDRHAGRVAGEARRTLHVVRTSIVTPGRLRHEWLEGRKKATGKLGLPRHLARFPLLGGAGNCCEPNADVRRRLCDGTHRGFIYGRFSRSVPASPADGSNRRKHETHRCVALPYDTPYYAAASSKRLMVGINLEESGLTR